MTARKEYTKLTAAKLARIHELIDNGWGNRRIALDVGTSRQLVNYHRRFRVEQQADIAAKPTARTKVAAAVTKVFEGPRILTFDIETLPIESYTWGLFDQNVGLNQIKTDWAALSIAAKWLGEDEVWYEDTRHKATIRDDKDMIAKLCALLDQADIVVGQNVKKFDMRKIRARAMMHGLPPFKEPLVQDTMLMARSIGSFTSNKLEYLSKNLTDAPKSAHAKFPGFELWLGVMQGNQEAWDEMREYNIQDVIATEKLYLALRPWVRNHPNVAHWYNDDQRRCPRCGSVNLHNNGTTFRGVSEYHAYTCSDCGGHSRSRFTLNTKDKRKALVTTI